MSKQSSGVIARINSFINDRRVTSSLLAGGLLASTAFFSAAVISVSGQAAMDAYSYPVVSQVVTSEANKDKSNDTNQATDAITTVPGSQAAGTPAYSAPITIATTIQPASAAVAAPAVFAPTVPAPTTPVDDEEPVDEPEATAGFAILVQNIEHATFRNADYHGQSMHINTASIQLESEEGHDLSGKQLTFTATALGGSHYCEVGEDKAIKQLIVSIPEASTEGNYICRVTVSDGTVSRSTDYSVAHAALAENPQPADGYDFVFNMPVLGVIDGFNVYTSKYNYAAFPGCDDNGFYVCESTASIAFDVRVAAGLTVPQLSETYDSEDTPGLSCKIFANPSIENTGYGIITLHARSNVADGIYVCGFTLVEGDPASGGLLVVELVNGQFRSITSEQFSEL